MHEADDEEITREGWRAQSLEDADWCLRRISELAAEQEENAMVVAGHIARLKLRLDALNAKAQRGIDFFSAKVREYAETHREELLKGGKKKSRALPSGTIGWRKLPGGLSVTDKAALLAWAQWQPEEKGFIRVKEEPVIDAVRAHFEATGETPPGTDIKPEGEEFVLKTVSAKGQVNSDE